MYLFELYTPKSRITNVEATVVQSSNIAASRNRAVIDCGAPFLFWRSKKEKEKNKMVRGTPQVFGRFDKPYAIPKGCHYYSSYS